MDDSELEAQVAKMSSHDLINNPETLVGGLLEAVQDLRKLTTTISDAPLPALDKSDKTERRRGRKKLEKTEPKNLIKQKMKSKKESSETVTVAVTENNAPDVEDDLLSVGSNDDALSGFGSEDSATSGSEADEVVRQSALQRKRGQAQFGELNKRFNNLVREKKRRSTTARDLDREFDLDATDDQLMPLLFPNYQQKEKLFNEHKQKIEALTEASVLSYFKDIEGQLLEIYEGRLSTTRSTLYLSKDTTGRDNAILKSLQVSYPFTNIIYLKVDEAMWNFLEIKPKKQKTYREFVNQIMIPEALVRIYAVVNNVSLEHAELEMKCGPQYEGPMPGKPDLRVRDPQKKASHYRYGKDFAM